MIMTMMNMNGESLALHFTQGFSPMEMRKKKEEVRGGKLNKKGEGGKLPLETRAGWEEETGQRRRDRGAAQLTLHDQTPEKFNCM